MFLIILFHCACASALRSLYSALNCCTALLFTSKYSRLARGKGRQVNHPACYFYLCCSGVHPRHFGLVRSVGACHCRDHVVLRSPYTAKKSSSTGFSLSAAAALQHQPQNNSPLTLSRIIY